MVKFEPAKPENKALKTCQQHGHRYMDHIYTYYIYIYIFIFIYIYMHVCGGVGSAYIHISMHLKIAVMRCVRVEICAFFPSRNPNMCSPASATYTHLKDSFCQLLLAIPPIFFLSS